MTNLIDDDEPETHNYDYDLIVIGGGSGGLACAKEAKSFDKKVALLDFVVPSPHGTKWGLGGTCVNVGCIPKKLMHQAALLGESVKDARHYGWEIEGGTEVEKADNKVSDGLSFDPLDISEPEVKFNHSWRKLVDAIRDHIGSLNFGYRTQLRSLGVEYLNAFGVFVDPHTIECTTSQKKVSRITARRFVIATGGRPKQLEIPGGEHSITSDDIFYYKKPPGKTLVIGASYVALECAGFLKGFGFDVSIMVRSIFLRGFDQQMAELSGKYMADHGVKFIRPAVPLSIEKLPSGLFKVTWEQNKQQYSEEYQTVLSAIGRTAELKKIGLEATGVKVDETSGKLITENERTNVPHIYALGDIIKDAPELTPVAIRAGRLLARRLYGSSKETMDYLNIPTTIFTPLEYGCCGYSEELATQAFGEDNLEVYHTNFKPLEWTVPHREDNACYMKIICLSKEKERVVGIHVLAPNAGEIIQGFSVAMRAGATRSLFEETVGIHPTCAEELTTLSISKRSGKSAEKTGC